jgi:hypothetical protein
VTALLQITVVIARIGETMKTRRSSFRSIFCGIFIVSGICLLPSVHSQVEAGQTEYVIVISVDGGGARYVQNLIDQNLLPNFKRFQTEGVWTHNARDDYDYTVTLPNHVTIVTARGVLGVNSNGHRWTSNSDPSTTPTAMDYSIQNKKGSYVYSVFDVVHDNGLRTGLYATKTKFSLFDHSYNNGNGAPDTTGSDNGVNKIDSYVYTSNSQTLTTSFIAAMQTNPYNYALVHFTDGDTYGHSSGWGSVQYNNALIAVDGYLGQIFNLVASDSVLHGKTSIILTADHGGTGTDHSDKTNPLNYTIPVYIWGPDVQATEERDLYALNSTVRLSPGTARPAYTAAVQPIRNGDSANLALRMLSLDVIPDSTINNAQDLGVNSHPPVNGVCGSANGQTLSDTPTANLCDSGTESAVTGTGPWTWNCIGRYLGINTSCSADYSIPIYRGIRVTTAGAGVGTVTSSPSGIACTSGSGSGCSSSFADGTSVQLTAVADSKSLFSEWTDCPASVGSTCLMVMDSDKAVVATFPLKKQYSITVTAAGVNGGRVSDGSTINATWNGFVLSGTSTRTVEEGTGPYTITATANKGLTVTWSGDCGSTSGNGTGTARCTIGAGIASAKSITATFSRKTKSRR